ncbi:MAG: ROK family protein [Patescibacteria group bacterium]|nr:MAG: ROK family protein [Patescibacteria group bacterium]
MAILGLDIGASKIYYVALKGERRLDEGRLELAPKTPQNLLKLCREINRRVKQQNIVVEKVGAGVPGIVEDGRLSYAPNFPKLIKLELGKELESIFGAEVTLVNDANAFTFSEATLGAAKAFKNVAGLTLGSGLGGGLVIDGKPYPKGGGAQEIGHTIIGIRGEEEAEDLASAKFFKKFGQTPDELRQEAKAGNVRAQKAFREFGKNLGMVIANLVNIADPEAVVLGGGIAGAYDLFILQTRKTAAKFIVNPANKDVKILKTALGGGAGAMGAALLAKM